MWGDNHDTPANTPNDINSDDPGYLMSENPLKEIPWDLGNYFTNQTRLYNEGDPKDHHYFEFEEFLFQHDNIIPSTNCAISPLDGNIVCTSDAECYGDRKCISSDPTDDTLSKFCDGYDNCDPKGTFLNS